MKFINKKWIFGMSVVAGVALVLLAPAYDRWKLPPAVRVNALTAEVSVAEQIAIEAIPRLKQQGFATIIDLRPDGETAGQPSAASMEAAAHANQMTFAYVPVPHGDIPDAAVEALNKAISSSPQPALMYCRSGRRAARTWSLVEASRPGGRDAGAILAAVKASGQSADDLSAAIGRRVAERPPHARQAP